MRRLLQNKKKHKISPILILTGLNYFFRYSFPLLFNPLLGFLAMFVKLKIIISVFFKCLLASINRKELDINSAIKPVITTARNVTSSKYFQVQPTKTLMSVIMTIAYTIVIPHTTAISISDCLV